MLRFDGNQQNSVKQLSFKKLIKTTIKKMILWEPILAICDGQEGGDEGKGGRLWREGMYV